jgi:hypothetical protein
LQNNGVDIKEQIASWQDGYSQNVQGTIVERRDITPLFHFHPTEHLEDHYRLLMDELRKNGDGIARKQIGQSTLCGQILFRLPINTVRDLIASRTKHKYRFEN